MKRALGGQRRVGVIIRLGQRLGRGNRFARILTILTNTYYVYLLIYLLYLLIRFFSVMPSVTVSQSESYCEPPGSGATLISASLFMRSLRSVLSFLGNGPFPGIPWQWYSR